MKTSRKEEELLSPSLPRLSCTTCFDALWFCYCTHTLLAPIHQMQQYYRVGLLNNCSGKWNSLVDCLTLKTKRSSELEEILETREQAKTHIWSFRTPQEAANHWQELFGDKDEVE